MQQSKLPMPLENNIENGKRSLPVVHKTETDGLDDITSKINKEKTTL